ncbi:MULTISPECIES: carbon-nitrogen hydrolase family protein [Deefgea]|uniref:Carbon-nitrogen hydrolase family protein n=1 Tax=Deefgea chitinilytica TaxID=570276 RepID=A0ABS2C8D6_9NEIS|nr:MULTISPECIES: carbon-nitrogen hydrolase family protein [Deefgea]MBM5570410.1 carbon-nitrogen hydrolase family protein [Deefgea chitinilytica]MBM9887639.1 carbon-nitrogen hydrolase family protein [Deefgea sp. CFH1-16]
MKSIIVAALQMISTPVVEQNLATARRLIAQAAAEGAQLLVLPEYFAIMGQRDTDKLALQEEFGTGPLQDFLAQAAREFGVWLVGGTIPLRSASPDRVMNSCLAFNPHGECVARYDKIHLFGFDNGAERFCESDTIAPGSQVVTFDTPFGRVGLSICYDLRFPELFRSVGDVDIWLLPAAFTATTGRAHWEVLLRARAIENQCFVIAPNQGGLHPTGRETYGHSLIVDPWGQVLNCLPEGEGLVLAELKASQLERVRKTLPALAHRLL